MFQLWWSLPVFMTLFTTDKAAKKPISYLSTKMWVVSSKMAIKTFFQECVAYWILEKMVLVISLIQQKVKFKLMHLLHWFLGTSCYFKISSSFQYVLHEYIFGQFFFCRAKQKVMDHYVLLEIETYLSKINAWNTLNHFNRYCILFLYIHYTQKQYTKKLVKLQNFAHYAISFHITLFRNRKMISFLTQLTLWAWFH